MAMDKIKGISKKISILGIILMILGISIIGYLLHGYVMALQVENKMKAELKVEPSNDLSSQNNQSLNLLSQYETETAISVTATNLTATNLTATIVTATTESALTAKVKEPSSWKGDADNPKVFARLTIPKIDLAVPVVEGVEKADIKLAIGHVPGTGGPGETGNSAYAGHRSHTYGKFFHRLGEIELGDEIIVETKEYKFKYIVTEKFTVNPDEVWVLDDVSGEALITLITCEPLYGNKYRLIVRGTLEN